MAEHVNTSLLLLNIFHSDANLTDCLKLVRDLSCFNESGKTLAFNDLPDPQEPKLNIQDPAAILVQSKNIWLAMVQVVNMVCLILT